LKTCTNLQNEYITLELIQIPRDQQEKSIICRQYSSILIGPIRDNNGRYAIKI